MREEIAVKGRDAARVVLEVRSTHHGPIVNEALGADDAEPLALRWQTLDEPTAFAGMFDQLEIGSGPELVAQARGPHLARLEPDLGRPPRLDRLQADRPPAAAPRRLLPTCRSRAGAGEFEWEGTIPYEELPEVVDPESGFLVTANNRIVGDDYPHHITSEWLDGFRAKRIEQLLRRERRATTSRASRRCSPTTSRCRGSRRRAGSAGSARPASARRSALERLRSWDGRLDPDTIAGTIYQAFLLRLAREVARAAIGDRDLCERWLDRADNGFTPHVTSPWRWHSHLMKLWEEGDEELIGRPWDELVLEALAGALDDLERPLRPRPRGLALGAGPRDGVPAPARRGATRCCAGCSTGACGPAAPRRR